VNPSRSRLEGLARFRRLVCLTEGPASDRGIGRKLGAAVANQSIHSAIVTTERKASARWVDVEDV
jgi:hypothetical protein